ncbi:MAG: amidohydrolase [Deltaproteobacteria bacterium]|nr:amidohydrolase [Deltaproteobacteria bacterium]
MSTFFKAPLVYVDGEFKENHTLVCKDGKITDILSQDPKSKDVVQFKDQVLIPGTVNVHTHSFQSLIRGFANDLPFEKWRDDGIYKYSKLLNSEGIYIGALFAFSEMVKYGVTTVCDFFYIHNGGNENAEAVVKAAQEVGIRFVMARTMYDWKGAPKQYQEKVSDAHARCLSLVEKYENNSMVHIYPAPHSLHGASVEMIEAGLDIAKKKNCFLHMHIAEAPYEVEQVKKKFGKTPILFLDSLGVCSQKLVGVHCVWVTDEEIKLMGENEVKLAYNPTSNMFLGDGVSPILKYLKNNVVIGLGTDGACSNNRTSVFDEMRMTSLLQKVYNLDGSVCGAKTSFKMGTENGGKVLGLSIGKLEKNYHCDFVGLNLKDISLYPNKKENLINNIVYSLSPQAIETVVVSGKILKQNGNLISVKEEEICDKVAQLTSSW